MPPYLTWVHPLIDFTSTNSIKNILGSVIAIPWKPCLVSSFIHISSGPMMTISMKSHGVPLSLQRHPFVGLAWANLTWITHSLKRHLLKQYSSPSFGQDFLISLSRILTHKYSIWLPFMFPYIPMTSVGYGKTILIGLPNHLSHPPNSMQCWHVSVITTSTHPSWCIISGTTVLGLTVRSLKLQTFCLRIK